MQNIDQSYVNRPMIYTDETRACYVNRPSPNFTKKLKFF